MLTADQISYLRDRSEQLLDPIVDFLIEDICKRIAEAGQLTGTASYQVWRAQNLGISQRQLKKEIAKQLRVSQQQAEKLLTQAAETGYNFDISRFPTSHAIPLSANSSLQQILNATVALAKDDLTNMTQTIGFVGTDGVCRELTDAYNQACDFAFQKISTGAQDYMSAIRDATKNLAEKGIRWIDYESGVHTSMEAAVRRNMMGALGLMQEQISQSNHDSLGCDGWEISAHAGSAPDHEPYQGKQYPDKEYTSLNNSLVRRISTLNCGHSAFPIIFGVNEPQYTPEELEQFRRENEEGVTYEGKHYTLYEASQRQRKFERTIRKQKRRILVDESLGDKERLQADQIKLVRLQDEYIRFSKGTGQRTQYARMETEGFNWKHAKAAESAAKSATVTKKDARQKAMAEKQENPKTMNQHYEPLSETEEKIDFISRELGVSREVAAQYNLAVVQYGGMSFGKIREASYIGGDKFDEVVFAGKYKSTYNEMAENIEQFIQRSPKWSGDIYRGANIPKSVLSGYKNGDVIDMMGVSSWTSNIDVADSYTYKTMDPRTIFHSSGTKQGTSIKHLAHYTQEDEVIVSSKARWQIKKIEQIEDVTHIYVKELELG